MMLRNNITLYIHSLIFWGYFLKYLDDKMTVFIYIPQNINKRYRKDKDNQYISSCLKSC